jgi:hypothetical protein
MENMDSREKKDMVRNLLTRTFSLFYASRIEVSYEPLILNPLPLRGNDETVYPLKGAREALAFIISCPRNGGRFHQVTEGGFTSQQAVRNSFIKLSQPATMK